jgi:trehalose 6-phosphate phosphatase
MPRSTPPYEPRMTPLPEGALAALAHRSQVLLCLDYDGTIAEIVEDPARATPHPEAPSLLRRIAARPDRAVLAIVSGREISVLRRFLGIDEGVILVGVHGLQILWPDGTREMSVGASRADLARLRAWVSANVPSGSGFRIEDKEFSIALHYRCAPAETAGRVRDAFAEFVKNNTPALTLSPGKCVIEALPRIAGKGHAVRALQRRFSGFVPVYFGDDLSDEDAFAAIGDEGFSIFVGPERTSAARFRVDSPRDVIRALGELAAAIDSRPHPANPA